MKKYFLLSLVTVSIFVFSQNKITTKTKKTYNHTPYCTIKFNYFNFFDDKKEIKQLNDSINIFLDSYKKEFSSQIDDDIKEEIDSGFILGAYFTEVNLTYNILENGYISVFFTISYYTLGAHANVIYYCFSYDTKTNKFLKFADIANIKNQKDLDNFNLIMQKHFKNEEHCFNEQPNIYKLDFSSFYFDDTKLIVVFPPYSLGSFACGTAEIKIPLKELEK